MSVSVSVCVCSCVRACVLVCMRVYMCAWNKLEVYTTLAYQHLSSFRTIPVLYTSTRTHASSNHLRTAKPTGLKVDIALNPSLNETASYNEVMSL